MGTFWKRFWSEETFAARVWKAALMGAGVCCGAAAAALPSYRVALIAAGGAFGSLSQLIPTGDYTPPSVKALAENIPPHPSAVISISSAKDTTP